MSQDAPGFSLRRRTHRRQHVAGLPPRRQAAGGTLPCALFTHVRMHTGTVAASAVLAFPLAASGSGSHMLLRVLLPACHHAHTAQSTCMNHPQQPCRVCAPTAWPESLRVRSVADKLPSAPLPLPLPRHMQHGASCSVPAASVHSLCLCTFRCCQLAAPASHGDRPSAAAPAPFRGSRRDAL